MPDPNEVVGSKPAPPAAVPQIPPVEVTVIGDGTGNGGAPLQSGTVLATPDHQPNVIVTVVTPIAAIVIRFLNNYLTVLLGLVTAGMATNIIPARDFEHLVIKCATLSLASAGLGLIKDLVTVFGRLEQRYPLMTGSV